MIGLLVKNEAKNICKDNTWSFFSSNVNIHADTVGRFSACYGGRPSGRFSNLRFGVTFKLIGGF